VDRERVTWNWSLAAAYAACVDGDVSELTSLVLDKGGVCDAIQIYVGLSLIHDF